MDNTVRKTPEKARALLNTQLLYLKFTLELCGLKVHSKKGKLIFATQTIDWPGWQISSTSMTVTLTHRNKPKVMLYAKSYSRCTSTNAASTSSWGWQRQDSHIS